MINKRKSTTTIIIPLLLLSATLIVPPSSQTTTVKSSSEDPQIFAQQPQNVLTEPSANVTLYCVLNDHSKQAIWCQNGFCTMGKTRSLPAYPRYSIIGDPAKGEHNLFIRNVDESDMGTYQCQVLKTNPHSRGYQSRIAYLNLIRPARTISIHKPLQIKENDLASVTCLAEYSYPASKIKWEPEKFIVENAENITHTSRPINRTYWSTEATINFRANHRWQGRRLDCWVIHEAKRRSSERRLVSTLIQFPTLPIARIQSQTIIARNLVSVNQGQLLNLSCVNQAGSKQSAVDRFRWIKFSSNGSVERLGDGSRISVRVKRRLQDAQFYCQVENEAGFGNDSIKINVLYGPTFFMDKDKTQTWAGVRMQLVKPNQPPIDTFGCYVDSNPTASIRWLHGNQIVSESSSLKRSDFSASAGQVQEFQCVAIINGLGTFTRTLRLIKDGSPVIRPISQDVVDIGSTARLVCAVQILPKFNELFWTNSASSRFISVDHIASVQDEKYRIEESWTDEEMYSILFIKSVSQADIGLYNCCALNEHGMSSASVWLVVYESSYLNPLWSAIVAIMIITSVLSILVVVISLYRRNRRRYRSPSSSVEKSEDNKRNGGAEDTDSDLRAISSNGTVVPIDLDAGSSTQRVPIDWITCAQASNPSCWYGPSDFDMALNDSHRLDTILEQNNRPSRALINSCINGEIIDDQPYRQQSTV